MTREYHAREKREDPPHCMIEGGPATIEADMLQGKYPLLIALVLGLMAGVIAYGAIKQQQKVVREGWAVKRILCAMQDIEEGSELGEEMVDVCEIPEKFVTESFIAVPESEDKESLIPYGQKVIVPLKKGDPILYSHFEARREFALSEAIPAKARAISIEVQEKSAVNQLVRPNDHVDVIGTFRDAEGKELIATTVLQNIIVLATGRTTGTSVSATDEDKKYTHVALLVLPEEAEILALAAESGTLSLTLRNPKDIGTEDVRDTKTTLATIFTGDRQQVEMKKRVESFQATTAIEVFAGPSKRLEEANKASVAPTMPKK
jgi:pilus assembly protein CpaB